MAPTTTCSLALPAPASFVWSLWSAVEAWASWDERYERTHLDGPFRLGARGILTVRHGPKTPIVISRIDDGTSFETVTTWPGSRLRIVRQVVPGPVEEASIEEAARPAVPRREVQPGSVATISASITGPTGFLFRRVLGPGLAAGLPAELGALCSAVASRRHPVFEPWPDDPTDR